MKFFTYCTAAMLALGSMTAFSAFAPILKLKPIKKNSIKVKEPSDVCVTPNGNSLYIVSDNGVLFETDMEGKILRQAAFTGYDFEGVHSDENYVYVADEMTRTIHIYDHKDLKLQRSVKVPYSGGRNHGYESITYNKKKNTLILITEDNPIWIFELDSDYKVKNEIKFKGARDISAATWHNDALWFLSDEDRTVFKINPETYEIMASWSIPVLNPEGIAFDGSDRMIIASDDLGKLYYFNNPEHVK